MNSAQRVTSSRWGAHRAPASTRHGGGGADRVDPTALERESARLRAACVLAPHDRVRGDGGIPHVIADD
jgi:hypothetical protein